MNGVLSIDNILFTSLYTKFRFEVTQNMTEINMEKFAIFLNHIITWMSISNPKDISGDKIGCAWSDKILSSNYHFLRFFVVLFEKF